MAAATRQAARNDSWVLTGPGHREPNTIGSVITNDCNDHMERLFPSAGGGGQALFAIVGAPGVGKTTLARKIYHQMKEKQQSVKRLWVHVHSGPGNQLTVWFGEMDSEETSTERLLETIGQQLTASSGNKLLVVVDNVHGDTAGWSNFFQELRRPDRAGTIRIVVTTSNSDVARDIGADIRSCCHRVSALDEDDGWVLLRTAANLQDQHDVGEIQDIGRRMVRKCSGIPVALQVVGSKLRSKVREKQWLKELQKISMGKDRYIEVRRSIDAGYMELNYLLKRCFLYCSLYPEGSVIEQQHIVQQWVAEGFFEESGREGTENEPHQEPEVKARGCYKELLKRNLLIPAAAAAAVHDCPDHSTMRNSASATMPALLRSYALYRSKDENCVDGDARRLKDRDPSFKVWRLCVSDVNTANGIKAVHSRNMRTLLVRGTSSSRPQTTTSHSDMDAICEKFTNLRVLDLRDAAIEAMGKNLKRLLQLRYLNLSNTQITTLPTEVGNLVALQFLTVKGCRFLISLPEEVGRLTNLRSLDISETPALKDVRFRLAKLVQLNCFRGFLPVSHGVGYSGGSNGSSSSSSRSRSGWTFAELSILSKLTSLQILSIGSITDTAEAAQLMLHNKTQLRELELDCTPIHRLTDDGVDVERTTDDDVGGVLDTLEPHRNLDSLKLTNFGHRLPSWVSHTHLHELQRLTLDGNYHSRRLPPLGEMEHLKFLSITGSNTSISRIGSELRGAPREGQVAFPSLEQLTVAGIANLERWSGLGATDMPLLRSLSLSHCHKLRSLPPWLQHCTALTSLKVQHADGLLGIGGLHALKELQVSTCHGLKRICDLTRLEDLRITACSRLSTVQGVPLLRFMRLVEHQQEEWLLKLLRRMQQQQQERLRKLEIVASEGLLDQCSTGLAPYGLVIQKAADFVHAKLHDGSMYFSYTRSTYCFRRSRRCIERAFMYGMESTKAIVIRLIQGVITSLGALTTSNGVAQHLEAAKGEMEKFRDSLRSITLHTIDAVQLQADWTIAYSEATNGHLKTLADIAYEAENIIDRFNIETGVLGASPFQELKETLLEHMKSSSGTLELLQAMAASFELAGQSSCAVGPSGDDPYLIGSVNNDCEDLIRRLSQNGDEALFAIIGAPGVGKTALAQKIYHKMRGEFTTRLWVHVAGNLITIWFGGQETEIMLVTSAAAGKEMIMQEYLAGSDLLLVIDNLRDEVADEWKFTEEERRGFYDRGIRIVVTTTHRSVARKIGVNMRRSCCHRVHALDEDDGWLLLRMAGGIEERDGQDGYKQQAAWRRKVVRRCSGIPMALKVVASSYQNSSSSISPAEGLLSEDDAEPIIISYREIPMSIDASYMELGSRLKRCFLYCSLYPEGSVMERRHIVQQWVAQGFFGDDGDHQEEDAQRCYTELLDRGLLVPAVASVTGGGGAVMPPLLRSYAMDKSQGENCVGDPRHVGLNTWHLCIADGNAVGDIPKDFSRMRTLMVIGRNGPTNPATPLPLPLIQLICGNFTSLRVLDLRDTLVVAIGSNIKSLLQLRYLNLSNTWITTLPPEVGDLVSLQFLALDGCRFLVSLPEDVGRLINLRSLDISGARALKDVGFRLTSLDRLKCFRGFLPAAGGGGSPQATTRSGWTFAELSTLSNLTSLQILNLGGVTRAVEAAQLMLHDKTHLQDLELCCDTVRRLPDAGGDDDERSDGLGDVLESLKPHEHLASLKLASFTGPRLPSWLSHTHLSRLRSLTLDGCDDQCQPLPRLGAMRYLKTLEITRSSGALLDISPEVRQHEIGIQTNNQVAFPRLEELLVAGMGSWKKWSGLEAGDMPLLRSMRLSDCPLLATLPSCLEQCTALTSLKVQGTNQLQEIKNLPMLKELHVQACSGLKRICDLSRLEDLRVADCSMISAVGGIPLLRSLRLEEKLQEPGELPKWLLEQQQQPFSLRRLEIVGGETLLDKCSTAGAEYGRFVQDAADHVYGKLDDGSLCFSYNRSTRHFQRISGRGLGGAAQTLRASHMEIITPPSNGASDIQETNKGWTLYYPAEAVFASEVEKLKAEQFKPSEQVTLEPFKRDHACVMGGYRMRKKKKASEHMGRSGGYSAGDEHSRRSSRHGRLRRRRPC
ncbi:hypothetical protein HU200_067501 [Digitaria exilis]|uniref:AAA+ ATPase domain-containing protein n=1 Tax=Digitaria exilis TaxID=1010633 RepID=A0A834ZZE5_9POAL|nr:hypothetical protein HU200_067501 [Digitaria exilis]